MIGMNTIAGAEGGGAGAAGAGAAGAGAAGLSAAAGPAFIGLAAFQLWSGFQQAEMIREQGRLKRRVDQLNIDAAEIDAYNAEIFGYSEQARYEKVIDSTLADQRVIFSAQDVDVTYGTAAEIQAETRLTGKLNMLEIQRRARENARGFKREARNINLNSQFGTYESQLNAGTAEATAILGAGQTALSGYARR